jgi:hypothetical protein
MSIAKKILLILLVGTFGQSVRSDCSVLAPTLIGDLSTLSKDGGPFVTTVPARYQQVYNKSLFTNADSACIYITTLVFFSGQHTGQFDYQPWTVTNMQINLSTTAKTADNLSTNFDENLASDDMVVFGPHSQDFHGGSLQGTLVLLDKPFRYSPAQGNLLMDVRVTQPTGPPPFPFPDPEMATSNSVTDECSRVFGYTDIFGTPHVLSDSAGLFTEIQVSPIPALHSYFLSSYNGYGQSLSNIVQIRWPSQPSTFVLQRSDQLGPKASWSNVTDRIFGTPQDAERFINLTQSGSGLQGFYRLVWPGGQ